MYSIFAILENEWKDRFTKGVRQIDTDHSYIHDGDAYEVSVVGSVNTTYAIGFHPVSTATEKFAHFRMPNISTEKLVVTFSIYEGSTSDTAGTTVSAINRNRHDTKTPQFKVITGDGSSDYTLLHQEVIYGGEGPGNTKIGAQSAQQLEWVLDNTKKYVLKLTSTAAVGFGANLFWYEEDDGV